jgi:hypothetical protein
MASIELQAFMSEPIDWREFEEVTLALLDDRGGEDMPRGIHSPGVRKKPTPQPIKPLNKGK